MVNFSMTLPISNVTKLNSELCVDFKHLIYHISFRDLSSCSRNVYRLHIYLELQ